MQSELNYSFHPQNHRKKMNCGWANILKWPARFAAAMLFAAGTLPAAEMIKMDKKTIPNEDKTAGDWYQKDLFKLACCFHFQRFEPVGAKWDEAAFIKAVKAAGVSAVTLEAKDSPGYRYYEGKKGIKHPLVNDDYYGKRADALKKNGIKVIAYFSMGDDSAAFEQRPRTADG